MKYKEYKTLNLSQIGDEILNYWTENKIFEKSLNQRDSNKPFVFFEGPPSANGMPGIHHVMARAIKDIFCRFKTQKGFRVDRKAGWDTHGLPVEIGVEKMLGITKEDIGKNISVEDYNKTCRTEVMKYKDVWEDLTNKIGYWVDMEEPYVTFENKYIESVWYLLSKLYSKGLLYKGYTIQPYSPAAGTGLSTHELNQPGCYRDVKDTTAVAQFIVNNDSTSKFLFDSDQEDVRILAWTTTPWTLPSNTALAVGSKITYFKVKTFNQYTGEPISVILAKDRFDYYFSSKNAELKLEGYNFGDKNIPFKKVSEYSGEQLVGIKYQQLIDWIKPNGDAFRVVTADFVTTEDGTGIVHIAPTFGADDFRVGKENNIVGLLLKNKDGFEAPMVDKQGRMTPIEEMDSEFVENFVNIESYRQFSGRYVKNEYDSNADENANNLDVDIAIMLKTDNKAFKVEKYEHSYPHCWRTDKPILYYPLDSWFIKTTSMKDRLIELNKTINWKPKSTGEGRFGNWLENLLDWNLSRSRYWGIPLPLWTSEDKTEQICIGSVEQLQNEVNKSCEAGVMKSNPLSKFKAGDFSKDNYNTFDLHRPIVDEIILVSDSGKKLYRETDLIDVWFDSGAMPYAQMHYPFENKELFEKSFPADFIAEGVDQTRGWFFTLHAIATMISDSISFKTVISNGLVLDKNGNKMSKRLGNAVDPFETISKYGSDATRWYMITNAQPWDNLKFDISGIEEVQRKFFGTLYNTYNFFALYANIDSFVYNKNNSKVENRPEIDRWVISELNTLIKEVENSLNDYEPTKAGRAIQNFVTEHLSNWYVRLCRRRFWKGELSEDKIAAYSTLYECLETISKLMSPIAPFFADRLYLDLTLGKEKESVHLDYFPIIIEENIDHNLESRMEMAQKLSSMILSLRKKENIRVRQPLNKIMIPINDSNQEEQIKKIEDLLKSEVNVKSIEFVSDSSGIITKKIKPDFKTLGPKFGKQMKDVASSIIALNQDEINLLEKDSKINIKLSDNTTTEISINDVEIIFEDIPGWLVANNGNLTVALDINIDDNLRMEGIARDLVNRIQNLRKTEGFEVTDKIIVNIKNTDIISDSIRNNMDYICSETLTEKLNIVNENELKNPIEIELENELKTLVSIVKK